MNPRRWLLALAILAGAAAARADAPPADTVLYPRTETPPAEHNAVGYSGATTAVLVIILGAAAGWLLWHKVRGTTPIRSGGQNLTIEETKSLGNRQFLVVASYQHQKFLLGVCPGKIDLLSRLSGASGTPPAEL